jgi:hypothetical protein
MAAGYFIFNQSKLLRVIGFEENGSIKEGTFVLSFKNHEFFFGKERACTNTHLIWRLFLTFNIQVNDMYLVS